MAGWLQCLPTTCPGSRGEIAHLQGETCVTTDSQIHMPMPPARLSLLLALSLGQSVTALHAAWPVTARHAIRPAIARVSPSYAAADAITEPAPTSQVEDLVANAKSLFFAGAPTMTPSVSE